MRRGPRDAVHERASGAARELLREILLGQLELAGERFAKLWLRLFTTVRVELEQRTHERLEVGDRHGS